MYLNCINCHNNWTRTHKHYILLKGVLWQQREKRFSRWKERFFILTNDYLQCFRRGSSKLSEMGSFIFRIRLCEVSFISAFANYLCSMQFLIFVCSYYKPEFWNVIYCHNFFYETETPSRMQFIYRYLLTYLL